MDFAEPQEPQEPQAEQAEVHQEPAAPQYDLDTAYDVIVRAEGWDPRLARLQVQELKERKENLDRREREIEAQRAQAQSYRQPTPEFSDPYSKELYEQRQILQRIEEREQRREDEARKKDEYDRLVSSISTQVDSAYTTTARQSGMSAQQIEAESSAFFKALQSIYPEPGMINTLGVDRAVNNAFRVFKGGGFSAPTNGNPLTNRRATITIPAAQTGQGAAPQHGLGAESQRQEESSEDYLKRLLIEAERRGIRGLRDGQKVSSA